MRNNDVKPERSITLNICLKTKRDGHQRELLKILLRMELSEEHEGYLFDLCMNVWEKIGKAPSVRHNAFRMIVRIASKYPELLNDIAFITQSHYIDSLSPGSFEILWVNDKRIDFA